jgi:allantoinase
MGEFAIKSDEIVSLTDVSSGFLHIVDSRISGVHAIAPKGIPIHDYTGFTIFPGVVDTHVHINEPGRSEWEGYLTATQSAAAGGITTLVDMPLNCSPVTVSGAAFSEKLQAVRGKIAVDCGFYGGLIPGQKEEIAELLKLGVLGFKGFMCDSGIDEFKAVSPSDLARYLGIIAKSGRPTLVHAELMEEPGTGQDNPAADPRSYKAYLESRPKAFEERAIETLIALCDASKSPVHIVHLSAASALPMIAKAKGCGIPISVETCHHYLNFTSEGIEDGQTLFKCAPPIREAANQRDLWRGIVSGVIDFVVSDHSPCTPNLKEKESGDFTKAWGGIAGLQFGLGLMACKAKAWGISLPTMSRLLCANPARMVGLGQSKGQIKAGFDADFSVVDFRKTTKISEGNILHRHKDTPYFHSDIIGEVQATYLRGEKIFERGKILCHDRGRAICRPC